ncbi:MAG: biotin/lipoyl-containing protein [Dehalococcoidia bacterium]|jgi:biotin carboxyl carrier protein|nr:biotin/lipoyl-containing protein [Dehalococcoidia bacterium]
MKLVVDGQEFDVDPQGEVVRVGGREYSVRVQRMRDIVTVYVNERPYRIQILEENPWSGDAFKVLVDARYHQVAIVGRAVQRPRPVHPPQRRPMAPEGPGAVTAPVAGRVVSVHVQPDQEVEEGDLLLIIEAMKMENEIRAPFKGRVKEVKVQAGARVAEGEVLVVLEPI